MNLYLMLKHLDKHKIIPAVFGAINNKKMTDIISRIDMSILSSQLESFVSIKLKNKQLTITPETIDWCDIQVDDNGEEYQDGMVVECRTNIGEDNNVRFYFYMTGELHNYEFD